MLCRCGHPREHHWTLWALHTGKCHHVVEILESAISGEPRIVVECECREFIDLLAGALEEKFGCQEKKSCNAETADTVR